MSTERKGSEGKSEITSWIVERHLYWCDTLQDFANRNFKKARRPNYKILSKCPRWAGQYRRGEHVCIYVVAYVVTEGKSEYDTTIAHEVCHAYAKEIYPIAKWHGDFWKFLMSEVCYIPADRCHNYKVGKAKKISELLKLQEQMQALKEGK